MTVAKAARSLGPVPDRIARLFAEGHTREFVLERGVAGGWSVRDVDAVLAARGWSGVLDASGRVPRELRPAVTPGKPVPAVPAGRAASPTARGWSTGAPLPGDPVPPPVPGSVSSAPRPPIATRPDPASVPVAQAPVGELLRRAKAHRSPAVRRRAEGLLARVDELRQALIASEAADAEAAAEERRLVGVRAEVSRLEAELAAAKARLRRPGSRPATGAPPAGPRPAAPPSVPAPRGAAVVVLGAEVVAELDEAGRPVLRSAKGKLLEHGTWGAYLAEQRRGLVHDEACERAKDEHLAAMRDRSAAAGRAEQVA